MDIPGVDTVLFQTAAEGWPGEAAPSEELAHLFDTIPHMLEVYRFDDIATQLDEIARNTLEPSQTMRLHFLQGELMTARRDYDQAFQFYGQALDIAEEHQDLDSQITLIDHLALIRYAQMRNRESLDLYEAALAHWRERAQQLLQPRAEPEVKFLERIGATQWAIGELDLARKTLARCLTIAMYKRDVPHTDFILDRTARAIWTLTLTLRSLSDMSDGSLSYLHIALRRIRRAGDIHRQLGVDQEQMGRLHVRAAEMYLDLVEIHLQRESENEASAMRDQALAHVREAVELLKFTDSRTARLLPELTLLRCDITRRLSRKSLKLTREFEARLLGIELEAADIGDRVLLSKAATLRGEWCLWIGDPDPAIAALKQAIAGFEEDNKGEVTRALRLYRRALKMAQSTGSPHRSSHGPATSTTPSQSTEPSEGNEAPE